jgi:hypothetical protein
MPTQAKTLAVPQSIDTPHALNVFDTSKNRHNVVLGVMVDVCSSSNIHN